MGVERDKIKAKSAEVSQSNATKREDTHVRAVTAHNVAEIQAGASLLQSHVDAKYDAEARKDELAAAAKAEKKAD